MIGTTATSRRRVLYLAFWLGWMPLLFSACQKEDAGYPQPQISALKIGSKDSRIGYPGHDLHLEAQLVVPGNLATVKIQITPKVSGFGWTLTKTYTGGYQGLKNAEFHEHLDVPEDTRVGEYELLLIVTDVQGHSVTGKGNFTLVRDPTLPTITGLQLTLGTPSTGVELTMTGLVKAPNKIAAIQVEVQSATWQQAFSFTEAAMVGQTSYPLSKKLVITSAPPGHYHAYVSLQDQNGKVIGYENHFDIK